MTRISLVATDQLLSVALQPKVASGDQNSVELHVDFDSEWDGFAKSAVFFTSDDDTVYETPLTDGDCVIPHEVLANHGILYIGIRGVNSDDNAVKTSSLVKYKIAEGAPAGDGTAVEPTANVYNQILTAYGRLDDALAVERARINQFTTLAEGSTTGDAELMDARVDHYGVTHENVGTAVRSQFAKAIATIVSYIESTGLCNWNAVEIHNLVNAGRSVVFRTDDMHFIPLTYADRSIARFDRIATTDAEGTWVETIEIDADGYLTSRLTDIPNTRINDTAVGEDAWSSKNIVDKLCPSFTESGAMVTCEPVDGYPLEVTSIFTAGATAVTRCGKNLAKLRTPTNSSVHGLTSKKQSDGTILINGTTSIDYNNVYLTNYLKAEGAWIPMRSGTYTVKVELVSGTLTDAQCLIAKNRNDGGASEFVYFALDTALSFSMPYDGIGAVIVQFRTGGTATDAVVRVQIEVGNTATTYEPYNGETFELATGGALSFATIPALPGVNTLWADAGEVTVSGKADPVAIINKLVGNV